MIQGIGENSVVLQADQIIVGGVTRACTSVVLSHVIIFQDESLEVSEKKHVKDGVYEGPVEKKMVTLLRPLPAFTNRKLKLVICFPLLYLPTSTNKN